MLILKDMISHGRVRACYYHPTNNKLCIKVTLDKKHDKLLQKEIDNDALFQKTIACYVPRYYELVETDKGLGLVSDLIRDEDGSLSVCLGDWLKNANVLSKEIMDQFDDFFSKLLKFRLWFYDFNAGNFLIRSSKGCFQVLFVDTKSLNHNNSWSTLKLEYICPFLARRRMLRRIRRFYAIHKKQAPNFDS